jgi:hypothetical protein
MAGFCFAIAGWEGSHPLLEGWQSLAVFDLVLAVLLGCNY